MDINKPRPKGLTKSGCLTIFLAFFIVFAAFGIYVIITIGNYISSSEKASINYYCSIARLSAYEPYVERKEFVKFHNYVGAYANKSFKALESRKFKNEQQMLESLPESFKAAIKDAIDNGKHEEDGDIDCALVTRYYVSADKLPLDEPNSHSDLEHYYFVYKYPDGSFRFAILGEVTDPDY